MGVVLVVVLLWRFPAPPPPLPRAQPGDVLGAIQQLVDAAVLITAAGLIS